MKSANTAAETTTMNAMQAAMAKAQEGLKQAQGKGKIAKDFDINEVIAKAVEKTMDKVAKTTGHKMTEEQITSIIAVMMGNEPKKEKTVKKTATKKPVAPAAQTEVKAEEVKAEVSETKKPAPKKVMRLKVESEVAAKAARAEAAGAKVKKAKTREDRVEAAEKYAKQLAKIPGVKVVFNADDVQMSKKILKAEAKAEGKKEKKASKAEKAPVELVAAKASGKKESGATLGWWLNRGKK